MIGDKLILQPYHLPPAKDIYSIIKDNMSEGLPYFVSIGGESGCGKSTLAIALAEVVHEAGLAPFIIHMDDYFKLPPTSTHELRLEDINHVGPQEVNMTLLQQHIEHIKAGKGELIKPLVHYKENTIRREIFYPEDYKVFIIEGTYVTDLLHVDTKVFMTRDYRDTWESRIARARDPLTPFMEEVLEIEHQIIKQHQIMAHLIVDKDYNVEQAS